MPVITSRPFVRYWLPVIACAAAITVGTSLPRAPGLAIDGGDKLAHFLAYGLLGLLLVRALRQTTKVAPATMMLVTIVAGGLYAALDELHQIPLPGRTASVGDWAADLAGLAVAAAAMWMLGTGGRDPRRVTRRRKPKDSEGERQHGGNAARGPG